MLHCLFIYRKSNPFAKGCPQSIGGCREQGIATSEFKATKSLRLKLQ